LLNKAMKKLLQKLVNKETVLYIVFGVLTTLVNLAVLWGMNRALGEDLVLLGNAVAFVVSVLFAYAVNKLFVFESRSWKPNVLGRELALFFAARLFSFGLEELGLWIAKVPLRAADHTLLGLSGLWIAKILLMILTVILNYVFSKLVIFRDKN